MLFFHLGFILQKCDAPVLSYLSLSLSLCSARYLLLLFLLCSATLRAVLCIARCSKKMLWPKRLKCSGMPINFGIAARYIMHECIAFNFSYTLPWCRYEIANVCATFFFASPASLQNSTQIMRMANDTFMACKLVFYSFNLYPCHF